MRSSSRRELFGPSTDTTDDAGSGTSGPTPIPGSVYEGVERCCHQDTLHVATNGWTGPPGMSLAKSAAGVWTGALAAMLREMATHTGMDLKFIEQSDCTNQLEESGAFGGGSMAYHCVRASSNETIPLARFRTLWNGLQHGVDQADHGVYVTTSFMEVDTAGLLMVRRKADYGIWQVVAPFSNDLWIAIVLFVLVVAFLMPSVLREKWHPIAGGGPTGLFVRPRVRLEFLYHPLSMVRATLVFRPFLCVCIFSP